MAEQFLNHPQVGAVFEQVRGEAMPEHVWGDISVDTGQGASFLDSRP